MLKGIESDVEDNWKKGEVVRSLGRSYIPGCELCVQRRAKGKVLIYSNISLSAKCYYKLYSLFKWKNMIQ